MPCMETHENTVPARGYRRGEIVEITKNIRERPIRVNRIGTLGRSQPPILNSRVMILPLRWTALTVGGGVRFTAKTT